MFNVTRCTGLNEDTASRTAITIDLRVRKDELHMRSRLLDAIHAEGFLPTRTGIEPVSYQ